MNPKDYLEQKLKPIMETLIFQTLCEKPDDPALFMIKFLQKDGGYNATNLTEEEQKELEYLREEVKKYRKNEVLTYEINKLMNTSFDNFDEEKESANEDIETSKPKNENQNRKAISAESYGTFNFKNDFVPPYIPKDDQVTSKIKNSIYPILFFNGQLDNRDANSLIGAMTRLEFTPGQIILRQGEMGNCLYVIEKGELNCFKKYPNEKKERLENIIKAGEAFGEIFLLYNSPAEFTYKAKTIGSLYRLDRNTYSNIIAKGAKERRIKNEKSLRNIDLMQVVTDEEITLLAAKARKLEFRQGDYILKQGEVGRSVYIIEEGEAIAFGKNKGKNDIKYSKGDTVNEMGLIRDVPRSLSLQALTDMRVLELDRKTFLSTIDHVEDRIKMKDELNRKYYK